MDPLRPAHVSVEELDAARQDVTREEELALQNYHRCQGAKAMLNQLIAKGQERLVSEIKERADKLCDEQGVTECAVETEKVPEQTG